MNLEKKQPRQIMVIMMVTIIAIGIMFCLSICKIRNMNLSITADLNKIMRIEQNTEVQKEIKTLSSGIKKQITTNYALLSIAFIIISLGSIIIIYRTVDQLRKKCEMLGREKREELTYKLQEAQKDIDQLYCISGEGLRIIDKDSNIIRVNESFLNLARVSKEECLNKKCYDVFKTSYCHANDCSLKTILSGETERIERETERICGDGSIVHCILNASCIYDKDHKPIGVIESFKDITELKLSKEAINGLYQEIKTKNKQLEDYIYITTHELRSPLFNLRGFANELEENIKELSNIIQKIRIRKDVRTRIQTLSWEEIPECIYFINSATSKMENLVEALLRLSRLKVNELNIKELDMDQIVLQIRSTFRTEIKNNKVKINAGNLPAVHADEQLINQVFSNLLGNALHYLHPKRSGVINITGKQDGKEVIFCVEDNGIGIAKKYHKKIFDIFQRLEPDICPGDGIGLSIVHKILEKHGGQIWVESEEDRGSKFFFSLPT